MSSLLDDLVGQVKALLTDNEISGFATGSISTLALSFLYTRYLRRFRSNGWVTPNIFSRKRWIKGVVTNVGDADNFRVYHTPGIGWKWLRRVPTAGKGLKDQTLHIRIAGVDAPEGAHFGRAAQPYAAESLDWLKGNITRRTVWCQLLRRDQYSRIVANVVVPPRMIPFTRRFGKSLALEMLRLGWATTYEQAGAEYGQWGKDEFLKVEAQAKAARRGMWQSGTGGETPAQYKRRYAREGNGNVEPSQGQQEKKTGLNWFSQLWRRE